MIVGGHFWSGLGLLGLTLGRILALRNWKVALMTVVVVGSFSGYLLGREQKLIGDNYQSMLINRLIWHFGSSPTQSFYGAPPTIWSPKTFKPVSG
ncbi:hypothetical protein L3X07_12590 [Levilactobacillus brevis]|nr:hypothetical protein [Levilactobacillus brevis]